jgi:organic radical activating enzyme
MKKYGWAAAMFFAIAGCVVLCAGCDSGTLDEDADARGLVIKIGEPEEPPPPPPPPKPAKWVQQSPAVIPAGR